MCHTQIIHISLYAFIRYIYIYTYVKISFSPSLSLSLSSLSCLSTSLSLSLVFFFFLSLSLSLSRCSSVHTYIYICMNRPVRMPYATRLRPLGLEPSKLKAHSGEAAQREVRLSVPPRALASVLRRGSQSTQGVRV